MRNQLIFLKILEMQRNIIMNSGKFVGIKKDFRN